MRRTTLAVAATTIAVLGIPAMAQPPGGSREGGPEGPGSPSAVLAAIDADGNHEISAEEIRNAITALRALDTNKDGKLVRDEIHPGKDGRERRRPGPVAERRNGTRAGSDGRITPAFIERILAFDNNKDGKLTSDELPERMRSVLSRYDANKDGALERSEIEAITTNRSENSIVGGRRVGREGRRDDKGVPPSPEQMVADALEFDADKDGKLNKAELLKFTAEFAQRRPGGGGPRGGNFGGGQGGRGAGGDRPQRPARPE